MGFKKTSEGRVFFKNPDNDDDPVNNSAIAPEAIVPKDNAQIQILLLLKSLNAKLKSAKLDQDKLAQEVEVYKATLRKIEENSAGSRAPASDKKMGEAQEKIRALEAKIEKQQSDYISLEQALSQKQVEVSKKAARVEEHVKGTLKTLDETKALVRELGDQTKNQDSKITALKNDVEERKKNIEALVKKQKVVEETQKEHIEKISDQNEAHVSLIRRVSESETRFDKLDNKLEDARSDYLKLDRKIDKVIEDRGRILRKIERIELAVIETRDALNAKAMVLLTDQGAVAGVNMPEIGDNSYQNDPIALQRRLQEEAMMPWWRKPLRVSATSLIMMAVIAVLTGWIISAVLTSAPVEDVSLSDVPARTVRLSSSEPLREPLDEPTESLERYVEAPREREQDLSAARPLQEQIAEESVYDNALDEVAADNAPLIAPSPPPKPEAPAPAVDYGIRIHKGVSDPAELSTIGFENKEELIEAFEKEPERVAKAMNDLEPSSLTSDDKVIPSTTGQAVSAPVDLTAPEIIDEVTRPYQMASYKNDLRQRIRPDPKLTDVAKKIETQAFEGVPEAQHDMGAIYVSGHAQIKQDLKRAVLWFTEASDNGVANATYNLGVLYHKGLGVKKSLDKAMDYYLNAAQAGHREAQYNLAIANIEGVGTPYNPEKAKFYFEKAANQGVTEAAYNLGLIYENGLLGKSEPGKALSWYKYAADQGSPEAQSALEQLANSLSISIEDVNTIVDNVRGSDARATEGGKDQNVVYQIQKALKERGFYPGPVDGVIGPVTRSSIRAYQLSADLTIDGEPTPQLLDVLKTEPAAY